MGAGVDGEQGRGQEMQVGRDHGLDLSEVVDGVAQDASPQAGFFHGGQSVAWMVVGGRLAVRVEIPHGALSRCVGA